LKKIQYGRHFLLRVRDQCFRLIAEFEAAMEEGNAKAPDLRHHEQVKSIQCTFEKQVLALFSVIETMGNNG